MTKEEAHDVIARHYLTYINKKVYFEAGKITAVIKAIDVIEDDDGNFVPTCFLEDPTSDDPDFKRHIFAHMPLQDVIDKGRIV